MKILIAEDEKDMQKIIKMYLVREGYEVVLAADGQEALDKILEDSFDLVILDWMMPRMNGIEVCREIRSYNLPTKVIILTAKSAVENEITGLSSGADDYIRKPFEPSVLILRIKKMFHLEQNITCGSIELNRDFHLVTIGGNEIKLTKKEFELLYLLMVNRGNILSREQLLTNVWGIDYEGDERTIDTHIRRLRSKLGNQCISTHVGLGYRMEEACE